MLSGQCWCLHDSGAGYKVCGHPDGYSGTYYSIATDSDPSPWTIIKGLGKLPINGCADNKNGCSGDCATNVCWSEEPPWKGCKGTD